MTTVSYRFVIVAAIFVTCLITANIIAVKPIDIGLPTALPAAIVIFPLSYIFGDIITEVYGYRWARRVIWLGFFCNLVFVFFAWIGGLLPPDPSWGGQAAYESIFPSTLGILAASFLGYLAGEFSNSFVLAKMKIATNGRWLWARTIGSTVVGQGLDTAIFISIWAWVIGYPGSIPLTILFHWLMKVGIEAVATPFTYAVVGYLKKKEGIDTYDYDTKFNPLLVIK